MFIPKLKYNCFPGHGLMSKTAHELRMAHFNSIANHPEYITSSKLTLDNVQHNIESFVGAVEHPLAIAGPLLHRLEEEQTEWIYSGICTSEGALVASMNRGAKAISQCGGFSAHFVHQKMLRAPVFSLKKMKSSIKFKNWIEENFIPIKERAESYSKHATLLEVTPVITGKLVHVRFIYTTGDAAGQNMVTHCTWHACTWIKKQFQIDTTIEIEYFYVEGCGSSDKKVSFYSMQKGRGVCVVGECFLSHEVIQKTLRANAMDMFRLYRNSMAIARIDGIVGGNLNIANAIAGIFAATGQDLACIHESSLGILEMEQIDEGLYLALSIPNLVAGTVGGGTQLPGPAKVLEFMKCGGEGKLERFAKLIVGFALSLEISTCAAIASGQFARAHQKLGKNKPTLKNQHHH